MVKVKICGITNLKDAQEAIKAGADALGFVFYKKSPRYILPQKARAIIRQLPKQVIKAGVFVNTEEKTIKDIAKLCRLDILQFHGDESPEFCKKFKGYKVIKAFRVKDKINFKKILKYRTFACLFDAYIKSKIGGTGKKFNWRLLAHLDKIKRPVFLSGGLTAGNVKEAIRIINPAWVDVSSSLEIKPGQKDHKKIREFIKAVRTKG